MKCFIVMAAIAWLYVDNCYGQRLSMHKKNIPLLEVIREVRSQTGLPFSAPDNWFLSCHSVTVWGDSMLIEEVLNMAFKHQPLTYTIEANTLVIVPRDLQGYVKNENGEPLPGIDVHLKGTDIVAQTDAGGKFMISKGAVGSRVVFTSVNTQNEDIKIAGRTNLEVTLRKKVSPLTPVVILNDPYNMPGDIMLPYGAKIDNSLLNRRVSFNVQDRLEGVASGVLFTKQLPAGTNQPQISVRGRSTINAGTAPLTVLDIFPFYGDISVINPIDLGRVNILKDATSSSGWGVNSGNGVIQYTTVNAGYKQPFKATALINQTLVTRPKYIAGQGLTAAERIDVETFLFQNGHYNPAIAAAYTYIPPAVAILNKEATGELSGEQAQKALAALRQNNVWPEYRDLFFTNGFNQQYAANLSQGFERFHYYFSVGYDRILPVEKDAVNNRATTTIRIGAKLLPGLEITSDNFLAQSKGRSHGPAPVIPSSYTRLTDNEGRPLTVPIDINQALKDTAGFGLLQDWNYRPAEDFYLRNIEHKGLSALLGTSLSYRWRKKWKAIITGQLHLQHVQQNDIRDPRSYEVRHLANSFTQLIAGNPVTPIPPGGIRDWFRHEYMAKYARAQLTFIDTFHTTLHYSVEAGFEYSVQQSDTSSDRIYGYDPITRPGGIHVNYLTLYPLYYNPLPFKTIPGKHSNATLKGQYISTWLNATFILAEQYSLFVKTRFDQSSFFGSRANKKNIPVWSAGFHTRIYDDKLDHPGWISSLKWRLSYGTTGNIDKTLSAYTIAVTTEQNRYGGIPGLIINPPNPDLGFERISMFNTGFDFTTLKGKLKGSIDYYYRRGRKLIGDSPLDPTSGNSVYRGNTAEMDGAGIDLALNFTTSIRKVRWGTNLLLSHTINRVINYGAYRQPAWYYPDLRYTNPVIGKPFPAIWSFKYAGVDPLTGDPLGYYNGHISKDYSAILNATRDSLIFHGAGIPTFYASLRNTWQYKSWEFSVILGGKFGYFFRRPALRYSDLSTMQTPVHIDFRDRWRKPGDELMTNVPSLVYPASPYRDAFYELSEASVGKADHIRLQDIRIAYSFDKKKLAGFSFRVAEVFTYLEYPLLLWKASSAKIDPEYPTGINVPVNISIGCRVDFN